MKKGIFIMVLFIRMISWDSYAQKTKMIPVDKKNDNKSSIDPLATYERLINNGLTSKEMYKKLGDAYFYDSNYEQATKLYTELFKIADKLDPEYYFRYGQSLKKVGQLEKSTEILEKYKILANQ
jgi:tetratricopeptide (TPR) repeat protein